MAGAPLLFAVDRMLGRLAVWLRLLGYDATYGAHLTGRSLIRQARTEGRMILTRDRRLLQERNAPRMLFIARDHFRDQLRQVVAACNIDPFAHIFTRCSPCNAPVEAVSKDTVSGHVPAFVFATQEHFVRCSRCGRIYWPATHCERVRDELRRLGCRPPI